MNGSIHRPGFVAAMLAAIVVIGGAYALDGYVTAKNHLAQTAAVSVDTAAQPAPTGSLAPEVVYVRPAPSPEVIHVTEAGSAPPRPVIHVTVPTAGGEREYEGGERDNGGFGGEND